MKKLASARSPRQKGCWGLDRPPGRHRARPFFANTAVLPTDRRSLVPVIIHRGFGRRRAEDDEEEEETAMATEGGASASPSPVDVDTTGALWEHYFPPGSLQQQQQQPQAGTGVGGDGSSRYAVG